MISHIESASEESAKQVGGEFIYRLPGTDGLDDQAKRRAGQLPRMHGLYSEPVALGLQALGLTVDIVNPARIKGYGQSELVRNKYGGIDAASIARYFAKRHRQPWKEPTPEQRRLRAWCDRLKALKDMRLQEENREEACTVAANPELVEHLRQHVEWLKVQMGYRVST